MLKYTTVSILALLSVATSVAAQEIRTVERSVNHAGQQSFESQISCATGYTPIGFRIVSNRLAGNFKSIPEGATASLAFFDWAGAGSQASTVITLICQKT